MVDIVWQRQQLKGVILNVYWGEGGVKKYFIILHSNTYIHSGLVLGKSSCFYEQITISLCGRLVEAYSFDAKGKIGDYRRNGVQFLRSSDAAEVMQTDDENCYCYRFGERWGRTVLDKWHLSRMANCRQAANIPINVYLSQVQSHHILQLWKTLSRTNSNQLLMFLVYHRNPRRTSSRRLHHPRLT